ncbi:hypothetical protein AB205_0212450, partial [Aquarana catesbeiana]
VWYGFNRTGHLTTFSPFIMMPVICVRTFRHVEDLKNEHVQVYILKRFRQQILSNQQVLEILQQDIMWKHGT